jgi:hypothetical protein
VSVDRPPPSSSRKPRAVEVESSSFFKVGASFADNIRIVKVAAHCASPGHCGHFVQPRFEVVHAFLSEGTMQYLELASLSPRRAWLTVYPFRCFVLLSCVSPVAARRLQALTPVSSRCVGKTAQTSFLHGARATETSLQALHLEIFAWPLPPLRARCIGRGRPIVVRTYAWKERKGRSGRPVRAKPVQRYSAVLGRRAARG